MSESDELTGEALQKLWEQMAACRDSPRRNLEHDATARVFRLTAPEGTVEVFRDNPARYLSVEPDPQTSDAAGEEARPARLSRPLAERHRVDRLVAMARSAGSSEVSVSGRAVPPSRRAGQAPAPVRALRPEVLARSKIELRDVRPIAGAAGEQLDE